VSRRTNSVPTSPGKSVVDCSNVDRIYFHRDAGLVSSHLNFNIGVTVLLRILILYPTPILILMVTTLARVECSSLTIPISRQCLCRCSVPSRNWDQPPTLYQYWCSTMTVGHSIRYLPPVLMEHNQCSARRIIHAQYTHNNG
jgi:hypothetical protein